MVKCCGKEYDLDDVFAYSTNRVVRIRHRKVGVCYYSFLGLVVVYFVGVELLMLQAFKAPADSVGTTRVSLLEPAPGLRHARNEFCGQSGSAECHPDCTAPKLPCEFLDAAQAVFPAATSSGTFLTTRVNRTVQELCSPACAGLPVPSCNWTDVESGTFYVADVDLFTVRIDHSVSAPDLRLSQNGVEMKGDLISVTGEIVDPCTVYNEMGVPCPDYIHVGKQDTNLTTTSDTMPIQALLTAAGSSLSDASGVGSSRRYDGLVLLVTIRYSNYVSYATRVVEYSMSPSIVKDTEFKAIEVKPDNIVLSGTRTVWNRHGIRILVIQSGHIGAFEFQTLLVQLVSSFGLISVVTLVLDGCLQYVLPLRTIYRQYKSIKSLEIADFTEEELKVIRVNPRPRIPAHLLATMRRRRSRSTQRTTSADGELGDVASARAPTTTGGADTQGPRLPLRRDSSRTRSSCCRCCCCCCCACCTSWEGFREYSTWYGDWFRRIRNVYRDTVLPRQGKYLRREHPVLALLDPKQHKTFPAGRVGRAVVLGIVACFDVLITIGAAYLSGWTTTSTQFFLVQYLAGTAATLAMFSLMSMCVKQYGRRRRQTRTCLLWALLGGFAAIMVTALVLAFLVWDDDLPHGEAGTPMGDDGVVVILLHGGMTFVTTLFLEVPFHMCLRVAKPSGTAAFLLCVACCRMRTWSPWLRPNKFQQFFEEDVAIGIGDTSDTDSTCGSYVELGDGTDAVPHASSNASLDLHVQTVHPEDLSPAVPSVAAS